MAVVTNTFVSSSAVGNREELSDVVSMITPEDTPLYSGMAKVKATSTHPEYETDTLDTPAANAHPEGNEYSFDAITPACSSWNIPRFVFLSCTNALFTL